VTDDELVAQFENGTLPLELFHHADHVKMAFLYLQRYPFMEALRRFSESLAGFAAAHGKTGLYNETITWAYLLIIRERVARAGRYQAWREFAAANEDLLSWKDSVLKRYYRAETLASEFAKTTFVLPDKALPSPDPAASK
jgi:hypothetical protein